MIKYFNRRVANLLKLRVDNKNMNNKEDDYKRNKYISLFYTNHESNLKLDNVTAFSDNTFKNCAYKGKWKFTKIFFLLILKIYLKQPIILYTL